MFPLAYLSGADRVQALEQHGVGEGVPTPHTLPLSAAPLTLDRPVPISASTRALSPVVVVVAVAAGGGREGLGNITDSQDGCVSVLRVFQTWVPH